MKIIEAANYRIEVETLLGENKLPVNDLPASLDTFLVALSNNDVIGTIGLEIYNECGLLRSLAVKSDLRSKGIAGELVDEIEKLASSKNLKAIYLLTETADKYFDKKHYSTIARADVPAEVQQSSEFSWVCPQSAVVMKKIL